MAQIGISANRLELLQIAEAVAREKSIDRTLVLSAMEDAIQKAAKSRYGSENEIRAEIDPRTGEIKLSRLLEVVEKVTLDATEISLKDAKKRNPEAEVGDFIAEPLPPLDFGRVAAQNAKQVIVQKVREAERERQHEEYKDRVGEIVSGIVKRAEYGNVMIDLGRAEAIIRRDELCRARTTSLAIASAPMCTTCGVKTEGRKSFYHARARNSWRSCSRKRCRKFTTESLKSNRWRAIREAGRKSQLYRRIRRSIRSARASACAAVVCRP